MTLSLLNSISRIGKTLPKKIIYETIMAFYSLLYSMRNEGHKYIIIITHTRSGSTLLAHILQTHPNIAGAGELHMSYKSKKDLRRLECRIAYNQKKIWIPETYVMDKMVYNWHSIADSILCDTNVFKIFLLREPKKTLASILTTINKNWSENNAMEYYQERLQSMVEMAKVINSQKCSLLLTYEQLLQKTDAVFRTLNQFLDVREGFSEKYNMTRSTYRKGSGDRWGKIKCGKIDREFTPLTVNLSKKVVEQSDILYNHCYGSLVKYCTTIE